MKVRTKLNLILVLVILLVALGSVVSVKNMEDVKDKALETMDASSRQSYDDSIKEQVGYQPFLKQFPIVKKIVITPWVTNGLAF